MLEIFVILWLLFFVILMIFHFYGESTNFGIVSGFWLLLLGLAIIIDGVQIQSGYTINAVGDNSVLSYTYTNLLLPFNTVGFIWGFSIIAISIYIIYANAVSKAS